MTLLLFMAALQSGAATPMPPADWSQMPPIRWKAAPRYGPSTSNFVRDEVKAGRCDAAAREATKTQMVVEVAVLAAADGRVRVVVPRAMNCPTVEQYTAGLIQRVARDNVDTADQAADTWYRAAMTYSWSG